MSTPIYHITHINNLTSIINSGGLIALSILKQKQVSYTNIAYENIQDQKGKKIVSCGVRGVLYDYVPFYFAPRSPMLYTIHKGNVPGYQHGQTSIIHFLVEIEAIAKSDLAFVFTDGHPIMAKSNFYEDIQQLYYIIDWELMESKYWHDTDEDNSRKRRRQAEFLIHKFCPWTLVKEISVINNDVKIKVQKILQHLDNQPVVKRRYDWCY